MTIPAGAPVWARPANTTWVTLNCCSVDGGASVTVTTPDEFFGSVSGDLASRRGQIVDSDVRGNTRIINAEVPLSEMFGYATDLRSQTQGRAAYTMQFHSYQEVPTEAAREIVAKVRGE